jgi:hypothetical protein
VKKTRLQTSATRSRYCGCGTLESITNALGQAILLTHDFQLRLTDATFPDASSLAQTAMVALTGVLALNLLSGQERGF